MTLKRHPWAKIEDEVLHSSEPLNLRKISEEYDIPIDQVRNRSKKYKWRLQWEENRAAIRQAVQANRIRELQAFYEELDHKILQVALKALSLANDALDQAKALSEIPEPRDLKSLADVAKVVSSVTLENRGEMKQIAQQMVLAKLVPAESLPFLLQAIDNSDDALRQGVQETYKKQS